MFSPKYLLLLLLICFFSCDKDDTSGVYYFEVNLATVHKVNESFYFQLDNGKTLYPVIFQENLNFYPEDNQRVLMQYGILLENNSMYDESIQVYSISNINVSSIKELTIENELLFGSDPIALESIWISGNYINLSFFIYGDIGVHYVALVENTTLTYPDDDTLRLEVRHDALDDYPAYRKKTMISFDISSLEKGQKLAIKINTYDYGEKTYYRIFE